jgi:2-oxoglutarate dehydrogenase E2 component (dihydrolipoamide succinyltransferase)
MPTDVRIPELGESVTEATIVRWLKEDGAAVTADEPLLEIETEKAAMEVAAEVDGRLSILEQAGARVRPGTVVGRIAEAPRAAEAPPPAPPPPPPAAAPSAPPPERAVAPERREPARREPAAPVVAERSPEPVAAPPRPPAGNGRGDGAGRTEAAEVERVPMTTLRRTIAARLVQAQRTAAILTTFNEIDLGELIALRARHRARFKDRHGVDLGYMSLFARAAVLALREIPVVNASIDGDDVVYHHRVHLGIAVSTPRGLVVPVVRNADALSLAELERAVAGLAERARAGPPPTISPAGRSRSPTAACSARCSPRRSSTRRSPGSWACTRSRTGRGP